MNAIRDRVVFERFEAMERAGLDRHGGADAGEVRGRDIGIEGAQAVAGHHQQPVAAHRVVVPHLAARDTTLVAISRAPIEKLIPFKQRMGWTFDWVSAANSDFNYDFAVSFTPEEIASGEKIYNFGTLDFHIEDAPGISVFYRHEAGDIFHTYSCFARGLDMMNAAYHYLDLTPLGRHEDDLPFTMDWVRLRDQYQPAPAQASCCHS